MIPLAQQEDERMTVATLPAPEENPYLLLPDDLNAALQKLLEKRDFSILDESRITRYQRDSKNYRFRSTIVLIYSGYERGFHQQ